MPIRGITLAVLAVLGVALCASAKAAPGQCPDPAESGAGQVAADLADHNGLAEGVLTGCASFGGVEKKIAVMKEVKVVDPTTGAIKFVPVATGTKERRCVAGGLVLDSSCLKLDGKKAAVLKDALSAVTGYGNSCLSKLNGAAGAQLKTHLFGDGAPHTQICCSKACEKSVYPTIADASRLEAIQHGTTRAMSNSSARYGSIHVFDVAFTAKDGGSIKGTLFHEMLHRMGMCTNPHHDQAYSAKAVIPVPCSDDCRGHHEDGFTYSQKKVSADQAREFHADCAESKKKGEICFDVGADGCACIANVTCPKGNFDAIIHPQKYDPVYGCEEACFPNKTNAGDVHAKAVDACRLLGGTAPFDGRSELMVNGKTVCK
ncbi:MAG: hypothetical protein HY075_02410 [Deltaproteobacteria bacterium]|nr:hypothetical protein [Deltaproteobacteria bacterium]